MQLSKSKKFQRPLGHARRLVLQWHITERCNRRCSHCYQEGYSDEELPYQSLIEILSQFEDLVQYWKSLHNPFPVYGYINVSGGEPFIRQDFFDLLEAFSANREWLSFGILTNGSFVDAEVARRLKTLGTAYVQVSIEGSKERNDIIRGPGAYEQTISALEHLRSEQLFTAISFTAQQSNFREFPDVARLGRELKVGRVWSDRMIPWGTASEHLAEVLSPEQVSEFVEIMHGARAEALSSFGRTEIAMIRALQFLVGGGRPYHCGAGDTLITIQPNGDLYPCRRMPIRVGNVLETPLLELYQESELFLDLRNKDRISEGCEDCSFATQCRGGLKCLSYALTGDPFKADPGCWRASRNRSQTGDAKACTARS